MDMCGYIFDPLNDARKEKWKRIIQPIQEGNVLDLGCGDSGLYWALGYAWKVDAYSLYEMNEQYIEVLQQQLQRFTPSYIEAAFGSTIQWLREVNILPMDMDTTTLLRHLFEKLETLQVINMFQPYNTETYQWILSLEALECVHSYEEFLMGLRNVYNALIPGGTLQGEILRYHSKTPDVEALIAQGLEGHLNPTEAEVHTALQQLSFTDICTTTAQLHTEGNRNTYIFYTARK